MDHIFDLEMALTVEDITLSGPEIKSNDSDSDDETPVVLPSTNSTSNITICMKKTMITAASSNASTAVCMVCMAGFISGDVDGGGGCGQQLVSCGHVYHEDCITKWLSLRNSCPLCRSIF